MDGNREERTLLSYAAVPSVDRALKLLDLLGSAATGLSLSMISRRLGIPKSSAYYLVTTLAKRNLVQRNADRRVYSLGGCAPALGTNAHIGPDLKGVCSPHLQFLSKRLGMTAQVGVLEGAEARIVDRSELAEFRLDSWVGRHFDLHCTAIGKSLISELDGAELDNLFRSRGFPKHNDHTLSSLEALKLQLTETRRRGFSLDDEEHELGVRCVASPIFNYAGGVIGAICVFSSTRRFLRQEMPNVGLEVAATAREVSRSLNNPSLSMA